MTGIDLSCNVLTSWIPHELGNLTNLHVLNLSHNKLWGRIPASLSGLQSIESLDLSYNHLNGSIPTTLTTLDTLQVFNVSYNNLSSSIPYGVHFTTFDASSYQGNPFLCGSPLSKNCTTSEPPSITDRSASQDKVEDRDWIDMETFYVTFMVSGVSLRSLAKAI
ncbi:cuscuta receptor 1-like [Beta vulgaris subsp. vulgaris]|uniref:cuscuta receptor 1-like n=1 Tax=Beta vulgaris subsp. vulgaris TaxID=3555 RepID=UPI00053FDE28|nr:cuscuta receptor 1-like [Beta vulgaris subsp. vulgaris]